MPRITSFAQAHEVLQAYWPANTARKHRASLSHVRRFMDYLDNPQERYKVLHVTGTSGKTSTAYYAAALLHASGQKVGLTISPHVDELNERVQINMIPLPEAEFCRELSKFLAEAEASGIALNYFELLHAFAFWEFARQKVAYAVVEVGVGGLLDSTNVITRPDKVCVITDIGLDHTALLGNTLGEIATQKAGIIRLHNTVFYYRQGHDVMRVIRAAAERNHAEVDILTQPEPHAQTASLPAFQQRNFGLAEAAVGYILQRDELPLLTNVDLGKAADIAIPARMEILQQHGKTIILDAAHNAQKLHALVASVQQKYPGQQVAVLTGLIAGRTGRTDSAVQEIIALANHLIVTSFSGQQDGPVRSVDPQTIVAAAVLQGYAACEIIADPVQAFHTLLARPEPVLLVTGSFFLLNHIRPLALTRP